MQREVRGKGQWEFLQWKVRERGQGPHGAELVDMQELRRGARKGELLAPQHLASLAALLEQWGHAEE